MLFGGNSGSCGGCGCKSCQECTRTCTEPHTGDPFETKYTLYFEGVEIGNPGGVYLQASGDVDTSDPYDGMDGNGPWSQTVSSIFTLSPTSSRIPCVFRASFWRSNFVLGASTVPPPATTLITNEITITNEASSEGAILYDDLVLQPGESYTITGSIPVVSGAGDQSTNDPRSAQGSVSIRAACGNHAVSFSVSATISWDVKKRQHVLYGLVRECYEDPDNPPCATFCDGSPAPNAIYLTLSNITFTSGATVSGIEGTYVLERVPNLCNVYMHDLPFGCNENPLGSSFPRLFVILDSTVHYQRFVPYTLGGVSGCYEISLIDDYTTPSACNTAASGTGEIYIGSTIEPGSFDWELST